MKAKKQRTPKKAVLTVKVDRQVKDQMQAKAEDLGVSVSALVNLWVREFLDNPKVPASVGLTPNARTAVELDSIDDDIKHGRNIDGPFETLEEIEQYLDS